MMMFFTFINSKQIKPMEKIGRKDKLDQSDQSDQSDWSDTSDWSNDRVGLNITDVWDKAWEYEPYEKIKKDKTDGEHPLYI